MIVCINGKAEGNGLFFRVMNRNYNVPAVLLLVGICSFGVGREPVKHRKISMYCIIFMIYYCNIVIAGIVLHDNLYWTFDSAYHHNFVSEINVSHTVPNKLPI